MVVAQANGKGEILRINIEPTLVEMGDKGMIEDLVAAAVNQALARGRAVVATPELVAGLDLRDGNEVLIRDTPRSFADAVADVLTDRDLRTRLESAGRTAFEATFSYAAAESELRAKSSMIR